MFFGIIVAILLFVNGAKRLLTFRTTNQKVQEAELRLQKLKEENEKLKGQLEFTKTEEFKEAQIRDKLGLAKEGEVVVVLPKEEDSLQTTDYRLQTNDPNYKKWWNLFFGG